MSDSKKTGVREGKSRLAESKWMVDACHLVFGGKICSICLHKRVVLGMQVAGSGWSGQTAGENNCSQPRLAVRPATGSNAREIFGKNSLQFSFLH